MFTKFIRKIYRNIKWAFIYTYRNWKYDWGNLFIIIIPFLLALPITSKYLERYWIITFIVLVSAWIHTNSRKKDIRKIKEDFLKAKNDNEHLKNNMESIPLEIIRHLYIHWALDYQDRITIYRYVEDGFVPVGRYSRNKEHSKLGRRKYPKDVGFISECWHNGHYFIDDLPSYTKNNKDYLDVVSQKSGMTKKDLKKITMQSRSYFCKNLVNEKDEPIAVIVVESLNKTLSVSHEEINKELDGFQGKVLTSSIQTNLPIGGSNL